MKVAIVTSNYVPVSKYATKGTEIIVNALVRELAKKSNLDLTVFASGDSILPVKIESISKRALIKEKKVIEDDKHLIFELALLSKAFSQEKNFDLFHINIGNGDIALPFLPLVKKPVLITLHYSTEAPYLKEFFMLFKNLPNVFFTPLSQTQKKLIPKLNYTDIIPHGIDEKVFAFDSKGGRSIMWAGRAVPEKGLEDTIDVVKQLDLQAELFILSKKEHESYSQTIFKRLNQTEIKRNVKFHINTPRLNLIKHFQKSRLFLFPIKWEEPFGLVMIEAMACGTPVVAYAKGSVTEIIEDGKTGFIINQKKGINGLKEAVKKIYSMPEKEYLKMRRKCRERVEKYYTLKKMADNYEDVYKTIVSNSFTHT